jgi:signal peptidase II
MPTNAPLDSREPSRRSRIVLTLVVLATTLALDLWSKAWAWNNLRRAKPIVVIDPLLEFSFSFNLGAAFGFLNDASWSRFFFIAVTLLALAYMAWLAYTLPTRRAYGFVAVGLIAAGASGNLHDRLVRANDGGHYGVVDFIKVNYPWGGSWPTFNVADALLLVGVLALLVFLRREGEAEAPSEAAAAAAKAEAASAKESEAGEAEGPRKASRPEGLPVEAANADLRPAAESDDPLRSPAQPVAPADGVPADAKLDPAAD